MDIIVTIFTIFVQYFLTILFRA